MTWNNIQTNANRPNFCDTVSVGLDYQFPITYRMGADEVVTVVDVLVRNDGRRSEDYAEEPEAHCKLVPP